MRYLSFAFIILLAASFSHSRNIYSVRKDALTVGVSKNDSAAEYDFISEVTQKMKIPRFRISIFDNANSGQKLLLEGKIDVIISRVNYSPSFEGRFLYSPYGKTDIAAAVLASSKIHTLSDLNGKSLAFIPKDVSSDQITGIWKSSKPNVAQNLNDAVEFLQKGSVVAIIANRQSLEARKGSLLRVFPNKLIENNTVALFAPGSKDLQAEFSKAVAVPSSSSAAVAQKQPAKPDNSAKAPDNSSNRERIAKMLIQLDDLKKDLELLQKELK
jgi:hypothetical protein